MSFFDKIKNKAAATSVIVANTAAKSAKTVANVASKSAQTISKVTSNAYDSMCEFTAIKIKGMIRGLDLQSTIDAINQYHEETGKDVSALVNFIVKLKEFGEDGEK